MPDLATNVPGSTLEPKQPNLGVQVTEPGIVDATKVNPENNKEASTSTTNLKDDIDNLHSVEQAVPSNMEQLRRLDQLREVLLSGDTKANAKNDAVALDLLEVIKTNIPEDASNSTESLEALEELKDLINANKYSESNEKIKELATLIEADSQIPFTPKRNTEGPAFSPLLDTMLMHLCGNVLGPNIVKLVKTVLKPFTGANLVMKTGGGLAGFGVAEMAIGGVGLPEGMNLDHFGEKMIHKFTTWIENKNPKLKINLNKQFDGFMRKIGDFVLRPFGKKLDTVPDETKAGERSYSDELQNKIDDYLRNKADIDAKDPKFRRKLEKEMTTEDYQKRYGKTMPKFLEKVLDYSLECTNNSNTLLKSSLLMNELAEAIEDVLDKVGPLGKFAYNFLYYAIPNQYIFMFRPAGQILLNNSERYLTNRANELKIHLPEDAEHH
ncbi:MAG: hypothetical protein MK033_12105 [Candidatus Caenarcaniphilales bacterium]|nr:hypothetical protein [Candidatus Caenarcaniphilales bacterium]